VALTRARVWCVATGLEGPIFEELRRAVEQQPVLKFAAFNRRQLQRVLDEREVDDDSLFNGAPGQTKGQQSDAQHRA
jgi:hypothetical protein